MVIWLMQVTRCVISQSFCVWNKKLLVMRKLVWPARDSCGSQHIEFVWYWLQILLICTDLLIKNLRKKRFFWLCLIKVFRMCSAGMWKAGCNSHSEHRAQSNSPKVHLSPDISAKYVTFPQNTFHSSSGNRVSEQPLMGNNLFCLNLPLWTSNSHLGTFSLCCFLHFLKIS